jgi:ribosomal protein S18 acetylase RimI-like enzyme
MPAGDASPSLVVRRGRDDEVATAAEVQCASALAGFAHIFPTDAPKPTADELVPLWHQLLRGPPAASMWVAELDRVVVGVAAAHRGDGHVGHVSKIYVRPTTWAAGIGNRLLAAAVADVTEAGCRVAQLWVLEHNRRARAWYERHGWASTGRTVQPFPDLDLKELEYRLELAD